MWRPGPLSPVRKVGHSSLWSWPCCCGECAPCLPNSKVVPAFLIWFSTLSVSTPLGRVPPVTPAISVSQERGMGFCWWGQVCDRVLWFSSTSIYCTPALSLEIHKVPQERRNTGTFSPSGAYSIIACRQNPSLVERRTGSALGGQSELSGPRPLDLFWKKIYNMSCFCVCVHFESSHVSSWQQPLSDCLTGC